MQHRYTHSPVQQRGMQLGMRTYSPERDSERSTVRLVA